MAGSVAIHIALLIVLFQFRASIETRVNRYTATTLYVPAVEPVTPPVPGKAKSLVLRARPPLAWSPPEFVTKLPPSAPVLDLPTPPELATTRKPPLPVAQPPLPVPAAVPPAPGSPAFASALPAAPSPAHSAAPRTGSFGAVPVATAPVTGKLQVVGDTFSTVPADTPRQGSPAGSVVSAGFDAAVTAPNPHRTGSIAASKGFGGIAAAVPPPEPASKPKPTSSAFNSSVAVNPTRQPAVKRQVATEALEITFKPRPDYTEEARRARIEGDVVLEVLFTASGTLRVLRVVHGLGHGLDQNAIEAAAKIRFRPATENASAVDTVAMVRISFQIAY